MSSVTKKRGRGRPKSVFQEPKPQKVQALDRGLLLLADLSAIGSTTLSDMAMRRGMPVSTCHRILTTLQNHGFVDFDDTSQKWSVGLEAFRIGSAYLERTSVVETARPLMHQLMEETGETANLGIGNDGDVVFVSQVETQNPVRAFFNPGTRGYMHCSGIGKALLASLQDREVEKILQKKGLPKFTEKTLTGPDALFEDLEQTRIRGYAFDDSERYEGMRCLASVIRNEFGEAVAGVSISGPDNRFPDRMIETLGQTVRRTARQITLQIGGRSDG